jgi:large subunit ribosomal protein L5
MLLLKDYYKLIIKYDLINKFTYKNLKKLPKIKKISINICYNNKNFDLKNLAQAILSLELITKQKGKITFLKNLKISVKIRKGYPVGCKVTLKKNAIYHFFFNLLTNVLPKTKNFYGININKNVTNTISFKITNIFVFNEIEKHHNIFKNVPVFDVTFVTNTKTQKELLYLLHSHKLPIIFQNFK